jgi:putative hemolysin
LGSIPKEGQKVVWKHFTFEVLDMDGARIDKVLVTDSNPVDF